MSARTRSIRGLVAPLLAVAIAGAIAGCGDDEGPTVVVPAPELSGSWTLVSFEQPPNPPIGPPAATGTLTLQQTASSGSEASGSYAVDLTLPDGMGGAMQIQDTGEYIIDGSDGSWAQVSDDTQLPNSIGTFTLTGGNTLTVEVTQPQTITTVWQR